MVFMQFLRVMYAEMSDRYCCYVADPNIGFFRASRCDEENIDVMGWCGNSEFIGHLSASFVCISYTRFYPVWHGLRVKLSVLRTDCRATAAAAVSF